MRRLNFEAAGKVIFNIEPLIIVANFTAPRADAKKSIQIEQMLHEAFREDENDGPYGHDCDCFHRGFVDAGASGSSPENQLRQPNEFIQPGQRDEKEKTDCFVPKDPPGFFLIDHTVAPFRFLILLQIRFPIHDGHGMFTTE